MTIISIPIGVKVTNLEIEIRRIIYGNRAYMDIFIWQIIMLINTKVMFEPDQHVDVDNAWAKSIII